GGPSAFTPIRNANMECRSGIGPPQGTAPATGSLPRLSMCKYSEKNARTMHNYFFTVGKPSFFVFFLPFTK
ncbi:MAG: hypothetical protein PUF37_10055, partial [Prevotellaceae bacterium]|nr:hypothetical protein [Prevotellaceae bacterium]